MLSLKYKDIKNRYFFSVNELQKCVSKFVFINLLNSPKVLTRDKPKIVLFRNLILESRYSKTKLQRRCLLTNRARVSSRNFNISRIKLRELLKFNIIPGYKKTSW